MQKALIVLSLIFSQYCWSNPPAGNQYVKLGAQIFHSQGQQYLSLNYKNEKDWHTYWVNPGDAGVAIKNNFTLQDKPLELVELQRPAPYRFDEGGGVITYGHKGEYSLFYQLTSRQLKQLENSTLSINSNWLVCKNICVHGEKTQSYRYVDGKLKPLNSLEVSVDEAELKRRFEKLPQKDSSQLKPKIYLNRADKENALILYFTLKGVNPQSISDKHNILTPFKIPEFSFKKEKLFHDLNNNTLYGVFHIDWDGEYNEPPISLPKDGIFTSPYQLSFLFQNPHTKKAEVINFTADRFSLSSPRQLQKMLDTFSHAPSNQGMANQKKPTTSFIMAIMLAFLGGIILNLMPCVLPVISLKLFGMIKYSKESQKKILTHNLSYTFGVLISFWALAGLIIMLKSSGEAIGWGFQLQSPIFLVIMIFTLFIFSLNLFGLYEFSTPGGSSLGSIKLEDSYLGPILAGILATILSTPCSAPFLGTALTFAFTMGEITIFFIFTAIALGLAFPFLITGFYPQLIKFLPRPGQWMNKLKYFLGFTLLATMLWLASVFATIVNDAHSIVTLSFYLLGIFASIFAYQRIFDSALFKVFSFSLLLSLLTSPLLFSQSSWLQQNDSTPSTESSEWKSWSPKIMNEKQGELLFVDFTADWCLTCKVNKKLVLETPAFEQFVQQNSITLYRADWTKRDNIIGDWLAKHQVVGIPAYFLRKKDGSIVYLGETISVKKLKEAI